MSRKSFCDFFSFKSQEPEVLVKSWIGITTTQRDDDLDLESIFNGSLDASFAKIFLFSRQCEIFTSREKAFRETASKVTSDKSTYVLETPYEKGKLSELISVGKFHSCIIRAMNMSDYQIQGDNPTKIRTEKNPHFKVPDDKASLSSIPSSSNN